MKKTLLYILLHFSSAVLANWITVEHDFIMCDQVVPSDYAAVHINDEGAAYSTSFLVRKVQTVKHEPPLTTLNITMWGCTYDCRFSFMLKINWNDISASSYTNDNNNYKCDFSNYTRKLIPTPKITYKKQVPNPDHVFPTHLTLQYCSAGKHPDEPSYKINKTESVAECIDYLTGNEVGTYAESLQFGSGSSFSPDNYPVATYHVINSANKLFDHWERHHRGFHDALNELSMKMTTNNLKQLRPPPPPPPKKNLLKIIVIVVGGFAICAVPFAIAPLVLDAAAGAAEVVGEVVETTVAEVSEVGAEVGAAEDVIETTAEGSVARNAAVGFSNAAEADAAVERADELAEEYSLLKNEVVGDRYSGSLVRRLSGFYSKSKNTNMARILAALKRTRRPRKRDTDTEDNLGFFTTNMVNVFFLPRVMDNVHKSFTRKTYSDISSYLSAASENLQFHFNDTLHNNFFTANKSILASFTVNQGLNDDQLLDNDDDVYTSVKQSTYNTLAATIISSTLQMFDVEICDPKPSFCGQPCDSGHIYCPIIGNDTNNCVIAASDGQIKELKFLRDTFDICSTDNSTGWDIKHNQNCKIKQFKCQ